MKKIFIFCIALLVSMPGFAQRKNTVSAQPVRFFDGNIVTSSIPNAKKTATGDTLKLTHIATTDSLTIYKIDSGGYATGTNFWGDKAFAERYDFTDDTGKNMQVIGLFALFSGNVSATSVKTVTFTVWDEGAAKYVSNHRYYRGFPNILLDSVIVPVTQLGIGDIVDTLKKFMFVNPTVNFLNSFFIGYSINYDYASLNGDTLGLASTVNGNRHPLVDYNLVLNISAVDTALDTMYKVQNTTLESDNVWYDNYSQNNGIRNNLAIYPIIIMGKKASVKGITRNNLTFFGNYPNPATSSTNIRFSLANSVGVTIDVMDMNGRILNTIKETNLAAGEHIIPVSTSGLAAGDYLYLIRTATGDGMAGKMTVSR